MTLIEAIQKSHQSVVRVRRDSWEQGKVISAPIGTFQFSDSQGQPFIFTPDQTNALDWSAL